MLDKLLRYILTVMVVAGVASCSGLPVTTEKQASTENANLQLNAAGFVIGTLYEQPIDPSGKLFLSSWLDPDGSDFDQKVWDNFTIQSNETITEIDWYGGYDPLKNGMGGPVVDFTVAIYPSIAAGTEPAVAGPPLVEYQTGGNAGETSLGVVGGISIYAYAFSLPASFNASAGVKYWVHIVASQGGSSPDWGLAAGTGGNGSHYRWGAGSGGDSGFRSVPGDAAFTLLGPVPDTPTDILLTANSVNENQPVDTVVGVLTATDPDPNATFTFSLACAVPGTDDGSFNIAGTSLRTSAMFDYETKSAYNICIRVTNQGGLIFDKNFIIAVNDLNETPTNISLSANSVEENQPINTAVGVLNATDPDTGASFTFGLACAVPGADDSSFNILGTDLRTSVVFDFETKFAYNICVRVTDQGGLTFDKNFVITVKDIFENLAPTDISLSNTTVNENQPVNAVVGILSATDLDVGATFTFSLACSIAGADDGSFNILGTDLRTSAIFDFETKSAYNICARVTDQGGLSFDKYFVINVNDLTENSAPTDISFSNSTVDENQPINTIVGALTATDPDTGAIFAFSLSCAILGTDDGFFNINGTSLRTSAAFDFELKSGYAICIRVTDQGGLSFDKNFVVTVNNVNETPTDISLSTITVDENQPVNMVVGILSAVDPDAGATFTFSLACAVSGADDGSFNILGSDLRTSMLFDFETKSAYSICIRVADQGGLTFDKNFVITVNNIAENAAPTDILLSNNTVDENQPVNTVAGALSAIDPDVGDIFTFSLACSVPGVDDGSFNINGTSLRTSAVFDFETKSVYNICIRVTDQGELSFDKNFVVTVNNLVENNAPTDIALSNNAVNENQTVDTVVGMLTATDPDAGETFAFNLACAVSGTDDGSFNILGTDLRTSAMFDFETKSVYNICIRVTDQGGLSFDKNFVIAVNNVNEAPTDISLSNVTVDENRPVNTVVGILSATDPDAGSTFAFSLACAVSGTDDGSFNVSGTNLQTSAMFDYEAKSAYNICVRVTDQGGLTFDKNFVIIVNNVDEAPINISLSNNTVNENQPANTVVGALTATDPDAGSTFAFSLACAVSGADDGAFNVSGADLRTSAIFDYETKSTYNICIRVTDQGGLTLDKNFVITVNNVFENTAPTDIALSNKTVDENQPVNTVVGALTATDPDAGATFVFSLACSVAGVDDGSFNILGTNLQTSAVFDFETKSAYNVCIRVMDQGGLSFDKNFTVNVNDVNEMTNTPGKVTGGGNVDLPDGKLSFGFVVRYANDALEPSGNLTFKDHGKDISLKATSFTVLNISGNHAVIIGYATVNGEANVSFTLYLDDLGEPGSSDTFMIQIPAWNGYSAGGVLKGGNIQITIP